VITDGWEWRLTATPKKTGTKQNTGNADSQDLFQTDSNLRKSASHKNKKPDALPTIKPISKSDLH